MISKKYRLTERELGKVLARKKPFFSYMFIANVIPNKGFHGRTGILLSGKRAKGSVNRNFWRRRFYDISLQFLDKIKEDVVFVPKKTIQFDHRDKNMFAEFEKNIIFLYRTIIKNNSGK